MGQRFTALDVKIVPDGDNAWADLVGKTLIEGLLEGIASVPNATSGGRPVVVVRIKLPDGRVVLAQTTLALYLIAGDAFIGAHGDPRT